MSIIEVIVLVLSYASVLVSGISLGMCLERWLLRRCFLEELNAKTRRFETNLDRLLTRLERL